MTAATFIVLRGEEEGGLWGRAGGQGDRMSDGMMQQSFAGALNGGQAEEAHGARGLHKEGPHKEREGSRRATSMQGHARRFIDHQGALAAFRSSIADGGVGERFGFEPHQEP